MSTRAAEEEEAEGADGKQGSRTLEEQQMEARACLGPIGQSLASVLLFKLKDLPR